MVPVPPLLYSRALLGAAARDEVRSAMTPEQVATAERFAAGPSSGD